MTFSLVGGGGVFWLSSTNDVIVPPLASSLHPSVFTSYNSTLLGSACPKLMHIHDGPWSCAQEVPSVPLLARQGTWKRGFFFKRFSLSSKINQYFKTGNTKISESKHQNYCSHAPQRFHSHCSHKWVQKWFIFMCGFVVRKKYIYHYINSPLYAVKNFVNNESTPVNGIYDLL